MFYSVHVVRKLNSESDPIVQAVARAVEQTAAANHVRVVDIEDIHPSTLIVAVGGDGTMLQAMRLAAQHDATSLGINLGHLGFLTELSIQDCRPSLEHVIGSILTNSIPTHVEERTVLATSLSDATLACNEVSVSQLYSDSMITYHLRVGQISAGIHKANSILVSTATGSTAYSLSAGGALMMPDLDAIQIVPVAPMTMTSRPIIVGPTSIITLEVWGNGIAVRNDGQILVSNDQAFTKSGPFTFQIRSYIRKAKILHLDEWNFFNVLTEKLGWIKR